MANIIRCKLPDGIHRFKPFKVSDYRDFLLVRNDILTKDENEEIEIINELVADYFGEYPKTWQPFIFLQVFTGSIGKTKIPINFECPECGKVHKKILNLSVDSLKNPEIDIGDVTLYFDYPEKNYDDIALCALDCIRKVKYDNKIYNWCDILDKSKKDIIDLITFENFEQISKMLKPFHFELNLTCCDKYRIVYDDITSLFKLLLNPDEVFPFYEINDILIKNKYDHTSIMNLLPAERSMILALIERNNKK